MRTRRIILTFLVAMSLALLPMAGAFAVPKDEVTGSDEVVASAHDCCDDEDSPMRSLNMYRKFALAGAVLAAAVTLTSTAFAGANDYAFEPVKAQVKKGNGVTLTVRLVHKPTGKPVSDAVIISPRIDMS